MQKFRDEYPELAAMFQVLECGMYDAEPPEGDQTFWAAGYDLRCAVSWASGGKEAIAAGLRIVADAIDPPSVEVRREIAETLGPSMLTPDEWEARLTARNMEREKLGPQGVPPQTRG